SASLVALSVDGAPGRIHAVYSAEASAREDRITEEATAQYFSADPTAVQDARPVILVVGDSYTPAWTAAIGRLVDAKRYRVVPVMYRGCDVSLEPGRVVVRPLEPMYEQNCGFMNASVNNPELIASAEIVMLTSHRPFEYLPNPFRFDLLRHLHERNPGLRFYVFGNYFQLKYPEHVSCLNIMFVSKRGPSICRDMSVYPDPDMAVDRQPLFDKMRVPFE
ncbi:MAG TPA: hypothetical protein VEA81_16970, partial [Burkholderiaceae bacterium]|nr:hypothetical protein [Burkholderiaceae bacterium]